MKLDDNQGNAKAWKRLQAERKRVVNGGGETIPLKAATGESDAIRGRDEQGGALRNGFVYEKK